MAITKTKITVNKLVYKVPDHIKKQVLDTLAPYRNLAVPVENPAKKGPEPPKAPLEKKVKKFSGRLNRR